MSSRAVQRAVAVVLCAGAFVGAGATAASAGEITGTGRTLEVVPVEGDDPVVHGKSECAYSGLNDEYYRDHIFTDPRVQTPAGAKRIVGYACNGS